MRKNMGLALLVFVAATSLMAHGRKIESRARCEGRPAYVIAQGQRTIIRGCMEVGDAGDYRRKFDAPFVWFQKNGSAYLIRDSAWVARAADAFGENSSMKAARKEMAASERELARHEREIERSVEKIEGKIERLEEQDREGQQELRVSLEKQHRELEAKAKAMEKQAEQLEEAAEEMERGLEKMERDADKKLDKLFSEAISKGVAKKVAE